MTEQDRQQPAQPTPVTFTPGAGTRSRMRSADPDGALTQLVRARRLGPDAVDAVRQGIARDSRLGIGYLGIGAVIIGALLVLRGLFSLGWTYDRNELVGFSIAGWLIVIGSFAASVMIARRTRGSLPSAAWIGLLAAGAVALTLDHVAVWNSPGTNYVSVPIGVGATLLACSTFRPVNQVLFAAVGLTVVELSNIVVVALIDPDGVAYTGQQVSLAVAPLFAGVIVVRSFGRLVQRELDRTVAESTITAPRYGLGLLASAELARLDLAAEELLQDVASGRTTLPLDRSEAATASGLATDLRRLLVAGRRETWLHHAVADSEYLASAVRLIDPDGLAGYLEAGQRDGLLSTVWLIVDESGRYTPTIDVEIGRPGSLSGPDALDRMVLPIVMSVGGIPRRRIDPAVWSALSRVGQYSVDGRTGRLRVSVDAHVVVPDASR
ncbi:hypothetical protein [Herbiconiux flava]|uniref:Uncharacterized protein n=1 Tax=Herbiconiux flava TaxID=881268 RepID=A0A852SS40_9MICO|nr:hypothetical protein [Herbiconiux flava]NYD71679.1 hypothetical protein [Herbiconiux flava]GLK18357.1 hypothetical protein GCM10017602_28390 [Herbiconiux flava]